MSERDGRSALRTLWSYGVRVTKRLDGSLALTPQENVTPELRRLAIDAKTDILVIVFDLPAPGRCPICGDETGHDDKHQLNCTDCALLTVDRYRALFTDQDGTMESKGAA